MSLLQDGNNPNMKHPPRNIVIDWLNTIWETDLPPSSKLVACCLRRYMNAQNDMAWPSVARVTGECGFKSERTTQEHLKRLVSEGWLMVVGSGPMGTVKYQAATPAKFAPPQITTNTPANIAPELNKELNNTLSKGGRMRIPSLQEVKDYCADRGNKIDPETFHDWNTSAGWKVGNKPMKDWKAAIRTWEKREHGKNRSSGKSHSQRGPEVVKLSDIINEGDDCIG